MIAVIFEVIPCEGRQADYLARAADLRPLLEALPGFLGVERFQSLTDPGKLLSLSFFENESAVTAWRSCPAHRGAQSSGRSGVFADYRLRVAEVRRDYGLKARMQTPEDSLIALGG